MLGQARQLTRRQACRGEIEKNRTSPVHSRYHCAMVARYWRRICAGESLLHSDIELRFSHVSAYRRSLKTSGNHSGDVMTRDLGVRVEIHQPKA